MDARHILITLALGLAGGCAAPAGTVILEGDDPARAVPPPAGTVVVADERAATDRGPRPVRELGEAQPPVSGGTLLWLGQERLVAGDELTDQLLLVDTEHGRVLRALQLEPGAMPGRMTADDTGHVHVVLRGSGELLRVDAESLAIVSSARPCASPRGVDFEEERRLIHLACATGELVALTPAHEVTQRVWLDPDLRDVVALGSRRFVTRFRSAELLVVDPSGAVLHRGDAGPQEFPLATTVPRMAWRLAADGTNHVVMFHMRAISTDLAVAGSGSGFGLGTAYYRLEDRDTPASVVTGSVTVFDYDGLPVDHPTIFGSQGGPLVDGAPYRYGHVGAIATSTDGTFRVAVAVLDRHRIAFQLQDPDTLLLIVDGEDSVRVPRLEWLTGFDPGRREFHALTRSGMACASCHPGGGQDGHTWITPEVGPRRTQSLLGGLSGTEPFHWGGELPDFDAIMDAQESRLGSTFHADARASMLAWLDRLPTEQGLDEPPEGGAEAFVEAGCERCHAGSSFSDGLSHDVGAGAMQTPRLLGALYRAPYFHDGCAERLEATLDGSCRDGVAHLVADPELRAQIVGFVETL